MDLDAVSDWLFDDSRQDRVDDDDPKVRAALLDEIAARFGPPDGEGWAALGDHLENENFHALAMDARARAAEAGYVAPPPPPAAAPRPRGVPETPCVVATMGPLAVALIERPWVWPVVAVAAVASAGGLWLWLGRGRAGWIAATVGLAAEGWAMWTHGFGFEHFVVWGCVAGALAFVAPSVFRTPGLARR